MQCVKAGRGPEALNSFAGYSFVTGQRLPAVECVELNSDECTMSAEPYRRMQPRHLCHAKGAVSRLKFCLGLR